MITGDSSHEIKQMRFNVDDSLNEALEGFDLIVKRKSNNADSDVGNNERAKTEAPAAEADKEGKRMETKDDKDKGKETIVGKEKEDEPSGDEEHGPPELRGRHGWHSNCGCERPRSNCGCERPLHRHSHDHRPYLGHKQLWRWKVTSGSQTRKGRAQQAWLAINSGSYEVGDDGGRTAGTAAADGVSARFMHARSLC